jgi:hypothetical protein
MPRRLFLSLVVLITPLRMWAEEKPKPPADPKAIRKLVEQLGSDDFDTRDQAVKRLLELDETALPALKEAANGNDAEVRRLAEELAATIAARVEERARQKALADVNALTLEKFIERMTKEKEYATDAQWQIVARLVGAIEKRASEVADRPVHLPKLDFAKMNELRAMPATASNMARLLLDNDNSRGMALANCVVISNGPLGHVNTFNHCVVIVNGDLDGFTVMRNSVVLCRGKIGRVTQIDSSVILATGELSGARTINRSLIETASVGRCTQSLNNVYLNLAESPGINSTDDQCLKTTRGPLQLFRWTAPVPEKK